MAITASARRSLKPRSTMLRTSTRRAGAVTTFGGAPRGSPFFKEGVRQQLLESGVFNLELLQALGSETLMPPNLLRHR
jgi:hypothetical protein